MAHGAPDHSRMTEDAFAHYQDVILRPAAAAIAHVGDVVPYTTCVDADVVGVFGYFRAWADHQCLRVRIFIDNLVTPIFLFTITEMAGGGFWGYSNPANKFGVTKWDEINDSFGMVYDEKWGLYIHTHLKIEVQFSIVATGVNASWGIHYKKLI